MEVAVPPTTLAGSPVSVKTLANFHAGSEWRRGSRTATRVFPPVEHRLRAGIVVLQAGCTRSGVLEGKEATCITATSFLILKRDRAVAGRCPLAQRLAQEERRRIVGKLMRSRLTSADGEKHRG